MTVCTLQLRAFFISMIYLSYKLHFDLKCSKYNSDKLIILCNCPYLYDLTYSNGTNQQAKF